MKLFSLRARILAILLFSTIVMVMAEPTSESVNDKHGKRKNLIIREYTINATGKKRWMDHLTVYDSKGLKKEETDYAITGMRKRIVYQYDSNNRCIKEVIYDDTKKVSCIRKFEHNTDGTKKTQYNYLPNGRLHSTKKFQYTY